MFSFLNLPLAKTTSQIAVGSMFPFFLLSLSAGWMVSRAGMLPPNPLHIILQPGFIFWLSHNSVLFVCEFTQTQKLTGF